MRLQPRSQMIELMAALAFAAAAWTIAVSARAAKPSEASLAVAKEPGPTEVEGDAAKKDEPLEARGRGAVEYVVQPGDSLSEIAEAHGVRVADILAANAIANPDHVEIGAKLLIPAADGAGDANPKADAKKRAKKKGPEGVRITVPKDVTLKRIADVYGVPWKRIAKANGLGPQGRIRAGQKLFIPGATEVLEIVPCLKPPVELYRVRTDETRSVSLCQCNGKVNPEGLAVLSELAAPAKGQMPFPLQERVAQLLQKVAEAYPGKRLEIVSGQRIVKPNQKNESFHNKGRAIDFRVAGVPNRKLIDKVRTFGDVGVGYYPNSVFIHMDARDKAAFWVDYSRPGEKAIYGRSGMSQEEVERIRLARRAAAEPAPAEAAPSDVEAETDVGDLSDAEPAPARAETASAEPTPEAAPAEAPSPSPVAVNVPAAP